MADLKITDDKLEKILYSSMSPDVREAELKFQKKIGIRIIIMYILMAAAGCYLITGTYIFAGSCRYMNVDRTFLEIGNLFENCSFYVSMLTVWFSILLCAIFTVKQYFNMKNCKTGRVFYVFSYALIIFFQYYFTDRLIQPMVYINKLSLEVPNALKMNRFAIAYFLDGVKSSCSLSLLPAFILWGAAFILLLIQMFRER